MNPEKLINEQAESISISKELSNRELGSESMEKLKTDLKEKKLEELKDKITHKKTRKKKNYFKNFMINLINCLNTMIILLIK